MQIESVKRLQEATRVFWGAQIGAALRRMLPLVPRFLVRGFGPEAPRLAPTPLDDDGWLVLELIPGLCAQPWGLNLGRVRGPKASIGLP